MAALQDSANAMLVWAFANSDDSIGDIMLACD